MTTLLAEEGAAQIKSVKEVQIDIELNNTTLSEALSQIEEKTDFTFVFSKEKVDLDKPVNIRSNGATVEQILLEISEQANVKFRQIDATISVGQLNSSEDRTRTRVIVELPADITGKVTDQDGMGLPGVTILVKGTGQGTTSDVEGNFSLSISDDAVLVISSIGFITQEVAVGGRSTVNITLMEDIETLEDVVVIGYGEQDKRELTGSITSLKAKELMKTSVTGLDQAIGGRAGGVHILQNSGAPGGNVSVRIRGVGTPGNSEPLYVIDGIPVFNSNSGRSSIEFGQSTNVLNTINPGDIESIEVLKDGASASIYGSRSANGVVLITTKSGSSGKLKVNLDAYTGVQSIRKKVDVMNAEEYATFMNESFVTNGGAAQLPRYSNPASLGEGTDWQDAIFRNAMISNVQVSLSGGSDVSQYFVSGGYYSQEGIIENSDMDRYSFRFNSKHKLSDKVKFGNNITVSRIEENVVFSDQSTEGVVAVALGSHPTNPVYNPDGSYAGSTDPSPYGYVRNNPLAIAEERTNQFFKNRFLGSMFLEWEIIKGLKYKLNVAADFLNAASNTFVPTYANGNSTNGTASATRFDSNELIGLFENTFTYAKTINELHYINVLAGFSQQGSKMETHTGSKTNSPVNDLIYLDALTTGDQANGSASEWALRSYFGRINYNFDSKYLFSASIRADGSSRFAEGNQYGIFPAVSAGWRISEESFLSGSSTISDLKLRASWGQSGNQEIPLYSYLPVLATNGSYILGTSGSVASGIFIPNVANSDISWETTTQMDIGLDMGLFNNKVNIVVDYYDKVTSDILLEQVLPLSAGLSLSGFSEFGTSAPGNPIVNTGEVRNSGFELEMGYENREGPFQWGIAGNITTVKNEVTSLGTGSAIINSNVDFETRFDLGQSIGSFYGYVTDGIFQNQGEINSHATQDGAAPGDIRFKDLNNDNVIDDNDRTFIGSPIPDFYYGVSGQMSYKNFDFNILIQGVKGNEIYNTVQRRNENMTTNDNKYAYVVNSWDGDGSSNTVPKADASSANNNTRISDRYIHDGSYLRLKNIQLGYSLPQELISKWGMSRARFYVSAQNVWLLTSYDIGHDPEIGAFNQNNLNSGIDRGAYPQPKTFLVGMNLSF
ncbi:TonB-dependent receptor [Reichenbachiella carrageenanivorans]|uniref:TonB-dependent receptor n=1 Tax=Reichenbachiella carrageenanivorans TaxID=2979869 RepID=A0ABY6D120_9BACT|nr:TonB-dependent receptor [Reichenbachiella carrageenanivorans]UXX79808.1 TonB-dependent receptor [Reichenbachiella carrageenanivorans]